LDKFKKCHGITDKNISRKYKSVSVKDCRFGKRPSLDNILKDYEHDNNFNMDETEILFYLNSLQKN